MNNKKEVLKSLIGKKVSISPGFRAIYYPVSERDPTGIIIDVGEDIITVKMESPSSFQTISGYDISRGSVFISIDYIDFICIYDN